MTSLQAQSKTAACPLLAYPNLKSIIMPLTKLVVYLTIYTEGQILCRYSISRLIVGKNPNNTQNQNHWKQ